MSAESTSTMNSSGGGGYLSLTGSNRCPCCGYSMSNCYTVSTWRIEDNHEGVEVEAHEHLIEQDVADAPVVLVPLFVRRLRWTWPQARAPPVDLFQNRLQTGGNVNDQAPHHPIQRPAHAHWQRSGAG